jgi:hypothetical protein
MKLLRLAALGTAAYVIYRYVTQPNAVAEGTHTHDGFAAIYRTREQADLATEHLVQQHGVDRSAIFLESVGQQNTSGSEISGGDAASGADDSRERGDAPLNGAIRLTVGATGHDPETLRRALNDAGAETIQAY